MILHTHLLSYIYWLYFYHAEKISTPHCISNYHIHSIQIKNQNFSLEQNRTKSLLHQWTSHLSRTLLHSKSLTLQFQTHRQNLAATIPHRSLQLVQITQRTNPYVLREWRTYRNVLQKYRMVQWLCHQIT